jgi:hypothetical protein
MKELRGRGVKVLFKAVVVFIQPKEFKIPLEHPKVVITKL